MRRSELDLRSAFARERYSPAGATPPPGGVFASGGRPAAGRRIRQQALACSEFETFKSIVLTCPAKNFSKSIDNEKENM